MNFKDQGTMLTEMLVAAKSIYMASQLFNRELSGHLDTQTNQLGQQIHLGTPVSAKARLSTNFHTHLQLYLSGFYPPSCDDCIAAAYISLTLGESCKQMVFCPEGVYRYDWSLSVMKHLLSLFQSSERDALVADWLEQLRARFPKVCACRGETIAEKMQDYIDRAAKLGVTIEFWTWPE